jgi:hypothetical protein
VPLYLVLEVQGFFCVESAGLGKSKVVSIASRPLHASSRELPHSEGAAPVCNGGTCKQNVSDLGAGSNGDKRGNNEELTASVGASKWTSSTISMPCFVRGSASRGTACESQVFKELTNASSSEQLLAMFALELKWGETFSSRQRSRSFHSAMRVSNFELI